MSTATATIGSLCTGYLSPFGPAAFGVFYGRVITGEGNILINGKALATIGSQIYYAGFINVFGSIQYRTWIGQIITGSTNLANGKLISTVGSRTDALGIVLDGQFLIYG